MIIYYIHNNIVCYDGILYSVKDDFTSGTTFNTSNFNIINITDAIKDSSIVILLENDTLTKLDENGNKTTTVYNNFSDLTNLVQQGKVRLKYCVTTPESRKVLYTPHLYDDTVIRFDATGMLNESMYTRSIVLTKKSDNTIDILINDLQQVVLRNDITDDFEIIVSDIDEERKDILINIKEVKKLYLKYFDVPQKDYIKNNLNIMHHRLINRLGVEKYSKIDITFNNFLLLIDEFS